MTKFWNDKEENATSLVNLISKLLTILDSEAVSKWGTEVLQWVFGSQVSKQTNKQKHNTHTHTHTNTHKYKQSEYSSFKSCLTYLSRNFESIEF